MINSENFYNETLKRMFLESNLKSRWQKLKISLRWHLSKVINTSVTIQDIKLVNDIAKNFSWHDVDYWHQNYGTILALRSNEIFNPWKTSNVFSLLLSFNRNWWKSLVSTLACVLAQVLWQVNTPKTSPDLWLVYFFNVLRVRQGVWEINYIFF